MPVQFTAANQSVSATPRDVITSALLELNVLAPGEPLGAEDAAWGLEKLQRQIDSFNARQEMIFSYNFALYNVTPNHAPHTIGPGGDFNVPVRPVRILGASWILNSGGSNPVDAPIKIKDKDWWLANPTKSLISSIITHLYYDSGEPLGTLNFWPIANVSNPVRLETWNSLSQAVNLDSTLGFPQGYWDAMVYTLALSLSPAYRVGENSPAALLELRELQKTAMRAILANNDEPPQIATDNGMPNSRASGRPDFNFLTGLRE